MKFGNFRLKFPLTFLETLYQLLMLLRRRRLEGNIQLLVFPFEILQLLFLLVLQFLYQFRLIFTFLVQLRNQLLPVVVLDLRLLLEINIRSIQGLVFRLPFERDILMRRYVILYTAVELFDGLFEIYDGLVFGGNFAFEFLHVEGEGGVLLFYLLAEELGFLERGVEL